MVWILISMSIVLLFGKPNEQEIISDIIPFTLIQMSNMSCFFPVDKAHQICS